MALALAGLLGFLALSGVFGGTDTKEVPRVVGKQLIKARAQLERAGFEVRETKVRSAQDFDEVIDQDPDPGEEADEGSIVTLEVSSGPGNVLVPPVEGLVRAKAIAELEDAGLDVTTTDRASGSVAEGTAIRTVPGEGASVEKGSRIRLFVSSGPEQVAVPDVTDLSRASAQDTLEAEGLKVSVREEASDEPEDQVTAQDPVGGTEVDAGARVTITVSTGPEQVTVPDVTGLAYREAVSELQAAGLRVTRARLAGARRGAGRRGGGPVARRRRGGRRGQPDNAVRRRIPARRRAGTDRPIGPMKVAVLGGGRSSEHEVSLRSAAVGARRDSSRRATRWWRCSSSATARGARASRSSPSRRATACWAADVVFPALHGPFGEDGTVQGLLELLDVPYVGAGVAASALAMDKSLFKDLLAAHGVPQVEYAVAAATACRWTSRGLAPPWFVKPARLGSSVGISKAWSEADLDGALRRAFEHDPVVLVERLVEGTEVECSVLGHGEPTASRPGEIVLARATAGTTTRRSTSPAGWSSWCPHACPSRRWRAVRTLAVEVFRIVGCSGMARVDFFVEGETVLVNELNTIPGFTATSVYAKLLEADGIAYPELLDRLVHLALERHEEQRRYRY